jgi:carboxypeptidase C (cathepsin A)
VKLEPKGDMPAPPFMLVDNPDTWLEHCDLVFIDPVGTGYSRAEDEEKSKKFWSLNGDVESVAEFIRLYLTRAKRWASPLYIVGESYGTTRAAALSSYLVNRGIALNGIILVSSILNFQTARFHKGNDLPYIVFLPTYAATAWYHGALTGFASLEQVLKEAEEFALGEYTLALAQGDRLTSEARSSVIAKLRRLTGLSAEFIDNSDIRIEIQRFCKELLRNQKRTVGRLDSRFKGIDELAVNESPQHDPSMSSIVPPYTATINDYLTRTLGWTTDLPYHVFNPGELWKHWTYGDASQGHPDTSESLREAISKNPHMRILIASGYYDLATPYFATEFTVAHLGLDPTLRKNIETRYYEAGHMMYVHEGCLSQLAQDLAGFISPTTS